MKKYYLLIILLLFTQCDYKPIYSQNSQNFGIKIVEFKENRYNKILSTRLKNYSYKKNNLFLYELKLFTSENKSVISKNPQGEALLLRMSINVNVEVFEKGKQLLKKRYVDSFDYQNMNKKFELKDYEDQIRAVIYNKIASELLVDISNLK